MDMYGGYCRGVIIRTCKEYSVQHNTTVTGTLEGRVIELTCNGKTYACTDTGSETVRDDLRSLFALIQKTK